MEPDWDDAETEFTFLMRLKYKANIKKWPDLVVPVEYSSEHKKYGPSLGSIVPISWLFQRGSCGAVTKYSANEVAVLLYYYQLEESKP